MKKKCFVLTASLSLMLAIAPSLAHAAPASTISVGAADQAVSKSASAGSDARAMTTTIAANDLQKKAVDDLLSCKTALEYLPVPEFEAWDYTTFKADSNGSIVAVTQIFDHSNLRETNKLLPNLTMDVNVRDLGVDGNVGFWQSNLHHKKIVMDFMKSRTEPVITRGNGSMSAEFHAYGRIGVGLRLEIETWSTENKFDGSLIGLAASAKAKTTTGRISAKAIGIDNSDVTLSMPFNADLSEGSIQKIIEALAIIKSKLHQEGTTIRPHFLARVQCPEVKVAQADQSASSAKPADPRKAEGGK